MDRASDYGSEGWGFESLQAPSLRQRHRRPFPDGGRAFCVGGTVSKREEVAMSEDAPRPELFASALREQRQTRLKGGIYHLTQIQLAYNSNRIEGSRLSEDQTRYLYETRTVMGEALVDDVVESTNHFRSFDLMLDRLDEPLTAQTLKDYHRTLKVGTLDAERDWFALGEWKTRANAVGRIETTPPGEVDRAISGLLASTPDQMTFEDIVDFHYRFEAIHPFQDGNGRVGRLVMFGQCLANGVTPFVVLDEEKAFYYGGLDAYPDQPGFLRETLRHHQDAYGERFRDFV